MKFIAVNENSITNTDSMKIANFDGNGNFYFKNFTHENIAGIEIRLLEDTQFWLFIRDIYIGSDIGVN